MEEKKGLDKAPASDIIGGVNGEDKAMRMTFKGERCGRFARWEAFKTGCGKRWTVESVSPAGSRSPFGVFESADAFKDKVRAGGWSVCTVELA